MEILIFLSAVIYFVHLEMKTQNRTVYKVTKKEYRTGKVRVEAGANKLFVVAPHLEIGDTISFSQLQYIAMKMKADGTF